MKIVRSIFKFYYLSAFIGIACLDVRCGWIEIQLDSIIGLFDIAEIYDQKPTRHSFGSFSFLSASLINRFGYFSTFFKAASLSFNLLDNFILKRFMMSSTIRRLVRK